MNRFPRTASPRKARIPNTCERLTPYERRTSRWKSINVLFDSRGRHTATIGLLQCTDGRPLSTTDTFGGAFVFRVFIDLRQHRSITRPVVIGRCARETVKYAKQQRKRRVNTRVQCRLSENHCLPYGHVDEGRGQ